VSSSNEQNQTQKNALRTTKILQDICDTRQKWREARINQAIAYPDFLIQMYFILLKLYSAKCNLCLYSTSKMMRLSGNICMVCGRRTHIAGDSLCIGVDDPTVRLRNSKERKKKLDRHAEDTKVVDGKDANQSILAQNPRSSSKEEATSEVLGNIHETHSARTANGSERLSNISKLCSLSFANQALAIHWRDAEKHGIRPRQPKVPNNKC